jgi:hypothetical protein
LWRSCAGIAAQPTAFLFAKDIQTATTQPRRIAFTCPRKLDNQLRLRARPPNGALQNEAYAVRLGDRNVTLVVAHEGVAACFVTQSSEMELTDSQVNVRAVGD